jgi:hypothetical protein
MMIVGFEIDHRVHVAQERVQVIVAPAIVDFHV